MSADPPRFAMWVLRRCLPDDVVGASIAGDLREEFERKHGMRWRGAWYTCVAVSIAASYAGTRAIAAMVMSMRVRAHAGNAETNSYQRGTIMHAILGDFRDAWRGLRRRPMFTLAGAALLACGLAASSTVFSFVEAVMFRPLPMIANADRLVRIQERVANPGPGVSRFRNVSPADMERIAAAAPSLAATAAILDGGSIPFSGPDVATRLPVLRATAGFFAVLDVYPVLGRPFASEDEQPGAPPVAVLSHGAWQRLFAGRPGALGSRLSLNHQPHTVIGVMPQGFAFPDGPDVYLPLPRSAFTNSFHVATGLARVRPGVPLERARAEVDAAVAALAKDDPAAGHGEGARVVLWRVAATERVRPAMGILIAAATLVLLLATANLGGLLTNRTAARLQELSVRRSLGATNSRIMRMLLAEGTLLGIAGALGGAGLTALTLNAVVALSPADLPFRDAIHLNTRVLLVTALLAITAGMLAGLVPALRTWRSPLVLGQRSGASLKSARGSGLMVAAQIALATVLVAGAGLLVRSFVTALRVDPGIRTEGVMTAGVTLNRNRYDDQRQLAFTRGVIESLRAVPGVANVEVSLFAPLSGALPISVAHDDRGTTTRRVLLNAVSPGLLPLLGVRLLAGRPFDRSDNETAERVVLVSRLAASQLFADEAPIGRQIHWRDEPYRIVGVVADMRQAGPLNEVEPMVYVPFRQLPFNGATFVITGALDPGMLSASLRAIVRRLDPGLPVDRIESLASIVDESVAQPRFYSVVVSVFGGLGLVLAVSGLYAVVAFAARRRTFEFGVRSALGARPLDNLWLVFRQGLMLSLAGVTAGLVLAINAARLLGSLLYQTEPSDPVTLMSAASLTLVCAMLAVVTPAVNAARVDSVRALRAE